MLFGVVLDKRNHSHGYCIVEFECVCVSVYVDYLVFVLFSLSFFVLFFQLSCVFIYIRVLSFISVCICKNVESFRDGCWYIHYIYIQLYAYTIYNISKYWCWCFLFYSLDHTKFFIICDNFDVKYCISFSLHMMMIWWWY